MSYQRSLLAGLLASLDAQTINDKCWMPADGMSAAAKRKEFGTPTARQASGSVGGGAGGLGGRGGFGFCGGPKAVITLRQGDRVVEDSRRRHT